jgi:hypothetical protein
MLYIRSGEMQKQTGPHGEIQVRHGVVFVFLRISPNTSKTNGASVTVRHQRGFGGGMGQTGTNVYLQMPTAYVSHRPPHSLQDLVDGHYIKLILRRGQDLPPTAESAQILHDPA